jgi:hypothetical protein
VRDRIPPVTTAGLFVMQADVDDGLDMLGELGASGERGRALPVDVAEDGEAAEDGRLCLEVN